MQPTARRGTAHRLYLFPLRFWTPTQNRGNYGIATFRRRANGANCVDDREKRSGPGTFGKSSLFTFDIFQHISIPQIFSAKIYVRKYIFL